MLRIVPGKAGPIWINVDKAVAIRPLNGPGYSRRGAPTLAPVAPSRPSPTRTSAGSVIATRANTARHRREEGHVHERPLLAQTSSYFSTSHHNKPSRALTRARAACPSRVFLGGNELPHRRLPRLNVPGQKRDNGEIETEEIRTIVQEMVADASLRG